MPQRTNELPDKIKPFKSLGMYEIVKDGEQYLAECPFCHKRKFYIAEDTGKWDCKVCSPEGGNISTFLNSLIAAGEQHTTESDYQDLLKKKNILSINTLKQWKVVKSITNDMWLIPGYNTDGKITQLYRYSNIVMPTAGLELAIMGLNLFNPKYKEVYLCEGPWDGLVLWELVQKKANVLCVPGCNTFKPYWEKIFQGKKIYICYDNDHPKKPSNHIPSLQGIKRVSQLLSKNEILYLKWGQGEYNNDLKDGYDLRDHFGKSTNIKSRRVLLDSLMQNMVHVPDEWKERKKQVVSSVECGSFSEMIKAWEKALKWRDTLNDTLCVMLATALSTDQVGSQIFLQVIGEPGSGKTRLCEAMLTSYNCYRVSNLTGFMSGFKDKDNDDYSMLARANNKTWITPEADVIFTSPKLMEIMGQQRNIFDGVTSASYKNLKTDRCYAGLRTPWILAGTPKMLEVNQASLGDRFIKIFIEPPPEEEKLGILMSVAYSAFRDAKTKSKKDTALSHLSDEMINAYQLTAGYVDYLRKHGETLLDKIDVGEEILRRCLYLAEYTANMRARPSKNPDKEIENEKEVPTRLTEQYVRLCVNLAVVTQSMEVDNNVMRLVTKVAFDTSRGRTQDIVRIIEESKTKSLKTESIGQYLGMRDYELENMMRFLMKIKILEAFKQQKNGVISSTVRWRLTKKFRELHENVYST